VREFASLLSGQNPFIEEFQGMKSFLAGLGIGIGIGLIFAPMTGEETRGHLQRHANKAKDAARDLVEQGRERVRTTVSAIRGKSSGLDTEATGTETT
jgi:gas vesicle protein